MLNEHEMPESPEEIRLRQEDELERLRRFVDFVNLWCWRESKVSAAERISAIQYHPTARARAKDVHQQTTQETK